MYYVHEKVMIISLVFVYFELQSAPMM